MRAQGPRGFPLVGGLEMVNAQVLTARGRRVAPGSSVCGDAGLLDFWGPASEADMPGSAPATISKPPRGIRSAAAWMDTQQVQQGKARKGDGQKLP